jgi:FtsP/CotA-like multicopper oxidase with cupredoxin domain
LIKGVIMSYTALLNAMSGCLFLLLLLGWWATSLASGLVYRRSERSLRRGARWLVGLVLLLGLALASYCLLGAQLLAYGWRFAAERVILLPMLLLPAGVFVGWGLPCLGRLLRTTTANGQQEPNPNQRTLAAHPALLLPLRLLPIGSAILLYQAAVAPYLTIRGDLPVLWLGYLGVGLLFWLLPGRVEQAIQGGHRARLGLGWRALRWGLLLLVLGGAGAGGVFSSAQASRLPASYSLMEHDEQDLGGGSPIAMVGHDHAGTDGTSATRSVSELRGPQEGAATVQFTLVAQQQQVRLLSGAVVEAWTFNGQIPGPELRVRQGDLVEVLLINKDIAAGVTIHWHGLNVPNGEDGVAGVTQNALRPGEQQRYRFYANDVGTRWYHSHQQSAEQVRRGLFGALIIEPATPEASTAQQDITVIGHGWPTANGLAEALNSADGLQRQAMAAGSVVRLRLLNADDRIRTFTLSGAPFRVVALDGNPLHEPGELRNSRVAIAGGGRADLLFTMPATAVRLSQLERPWLGIAFSSDGQADGPPVEAGSLFDPLVYGSPAQTPFGPASSFDRSFEMIFDNELGFYNGRFGTLRAINGAVHPNTAVQLVREGELIKLILVNRSHVDHPMHLHGHHVLVLSRNGVATKGSPIWLDTVSVLPGESWEVAFRADNPGIWMDHCHNLEHVATGMMMHLAYEGVTTPYLAGVATGNSPE